MEWLSVLRGVVLVVAPIGFFYQRDLPFTYLVSVDNTTWFIAYWLFLPMAIWYAVEKFEDFLHGVGFVFDSLDLVIDKSKPVVKKDKDDSESYDTILKMYSKQLDKE